MTDLRSAMNDYLTVRRQLGFTLETFGRRLENYVEFSSAPVLSTSRANSRCSGRHQFRRSRIRGGDGLVWFARSRGT